MREKAVGATVPNKASVEALKLGGCRAKGAEFADPNSYGQAVEGRNVF